MAPRRSDRQSEPRSAGSGTSDHAPDAGGAATHPRETSLPWSEVREDELRQIDRERALRHLLLEVGTLCAAAGEIEELVRGSLLRLVIALDMVAGWVALPGARGLDVYSIEGLEADAAPIVEAVAGLDSGTPRIASVPVDPSRTMALPGEAAGGEGVFVPFRVRGPERGWLLLVVGSGHAIPSDLEGILPSAATFVGLSASRIGALTDLRRLNRRLEVQVARRTEELRSEKESLEVRVRERTLELELAKRSALDSERRLLDLERKEGVHQVAAGMAHKLNNPLGALRASVEFLHEELTDLEAGRPISAADLDELREAVEDSLQESQRMSNLIAGLFGQVTATRRAAVRTDLDEAVAEALRYFQRSSPSGSGPLVEADLASACSVGIPTGELMRWIFRILSALVVSEGNPVRVVTDNRGGRRAVDVRVPGVPPVGVRSALGDLIGEIGAAGGSLAVLDDPAETRIRLDLPSGCGERAGRRSREVVS